jgi:adenine-specific DNA-methyltransferase
MPPKKKPKKPEPVAESAPSPEDPVGAINYQAKRRHIPPAGLEAEGRIAESPTVRYEYNPHLPPVLRFSDDPAKTDALPELLRDAKQRPLSDTEVRMLADALRKHEPWMEWSGKREKPWFEVDPSPLHIHERVSTQAILKVLAKEPVQRSLFADPEMEYHEAVKFYLHDVDWSNRMILGDSLQVMASLARREDLAGKVQTIYFDPPYGIRFSSNFQPQLGQRDVKDRQADLTREPEMVKAYRDTWTLGVHSYLAYLRDRLAMAKELLADSGSIFVQIGDENLHRVRMLMDEVFGEGNFVSQITFRTTANIVGNFIGQNSDYLLWYAKDISHLKYRQLYYERTLADDVGGRYTRLQLSDYVRRIMTNEERTNFKQIPKDSLPYRHDNLTSTGATASGSSDFEFQGSIFNPGLSRHWKTDLEGLTRLAKSERLAAPTQNSLTYVRFLSDFPVAELTSVWTDTQTGAFTDQKVYVVQTNTKVIERCFLMTTDPGDLVLDPTCGSGTTAYVAEQWGRRWITIDTSRVALALAKQRLLTARFPYYKLRPLSPEEIDANPNATWLREGETSPPLTLDCKFVPHISLKNIARNASLDPIFEKHEPILAEKLDALNAALAESVDDALREKLAAKLQDKVLSDGVRAVTDADCRRWLLPGTKPAAIRERRAAKFIERIPSEPRWREWEVPFDADPDWPKPLSQALTAFRKAWRTKMDAVNECIAANAPSEELVDQPKVEKGVVRVSGPFSMESVIALEQGPDTPIGGAPEALDAFDPESDAPSDAGEIAAVNAEAHLDRIIRLLKASGVDFSGNQNMKFDRLEPIAGGDSLIHAEGEWAEGEGEDGDGRRIAVSIGPETGNLTPFQVEDVIRSANRRGYDEVVFAAFGFDAAAQDVIEEASHPKLRLHMALIRPDVAMDALLKTQPGSQLFTVFSAPRVSGPKKGKDGTYTVAVEGMDVYDPVSNALFPTDKDRIAAWFLDSDYDGRTFCICQAFFPDKSKWQKLARALGDKRVIDKEKFAALSGLESLPFSRPPRLKPNAPWRVAVKVIDPRGNEGLRVIPMTEGGAVNYG